MIERGRQRQRKRIGHLDGRARVVGARKTAWASTTLRVFISFHVTEACLPPTVAFKMGRPGTREAGRRGCLAGQGRHCQHRWNGLPRSSHLCSKLREDTESAIRMSGWEEGGWRPDSPLQLHIYSITKRRYYP